jgi:hypothetical protein
MSIFNDSSDESIRIFNDSRSLMDIIAEDLPFKLCDCAVGNLEKMRDFFGPDRYSLYVVGGFFKCREDSQWDYLGDDLYFLTTEAATMAKLLL